MPFKVSRAVWLKTEGDRIEALILMPKWWRRSWTDVSLHAALQELGLDYTLREVGALNDEMHKRGVVVDVE